MARRGKISELYDLAAIEAQQAKVMQMLNDVVKQISDVKPISVKLEGAEKTRDVVNGIKDITLGTNDLIRITGLAVNEIGELTKISKSFSGTLAEQKVILDKYQGTLEQNVKLHTQYKIQIDELKKKQKELDDQRKQGIISIESYTNKTAGLVQEHNELKIASSELMQTIKSQIKENQAAAGGYDMLNARLGQMRNLMRNLSVEEKNSPFGRQLAKDIDVLDAELKGMDASMGNFQRNVGNYAGAFKGAFSVLQRELAKVKADLGSGNFSGDALASLQRQEALLSEITEGLGKNFHSSREEMRAFQEAAAKIGVTLGQQSGAFEAFKDEVGQGVDKLQDIKDAVKLAASDTGKLDNMIKAAQGLAGAYGVVAGSLDLVGANSEEAQEATRKFAAVMTVLQGLQAIQNELTRKDSIFRGMAVVMQKVWNKTMIEGAVASNVLKIAMTGGLLLLIPAVAFAFHKLANAQEKAAEKTKLMAEVANRAADSYGKEKAELDVLVGTLQKEGISRSQKLGVLKELQSKFPGYFADIKTEKDLNEKLAAAYAKASEGILLKARAQAAADLLGEKEAEILKEQIRLQNLIAAMEKAKLTGRRADIALADKIIASEKVRSAERIRTMQIGNKILLNSIIEGNKAIADLGGTISENETKGEDALKKRLEAERKFAHERKVQDLQLEADRQKAIADTDALNATVRANARIRQYEIESQIIKEHHEFELNEVRAKAREEKLEIEHYKNEIAAVNRKAADAEIALATETKVAIIRIRKETSESELQDIADTNAFVERELQKGADKQIESAQSLYDIKAGLIEASANHELSVEFAKYKKGEVSKEQYEAKKLGIENKARRETLKADLDHYNALLDIVDLPEEKKKEARKKLSEVNKELNALDLQDEIIFTEKKLALQEQYNARVRQLGEQAYSTFTEAMSFRYEIEKNKIQESMDALDAKKQKEIEVVNQTVLSDQDKAAKLIAIEAKYNAQKDQFEKKRRQIDQDKARFEKLAGIFNIGIQTFQDVFKIKSAAAVLASNPVTAPLVPMALAQIPFVIASGALAAGLIAARSIPKYFAGIDDHPGGWAYVGDGGRHELVREPGGDMWITDNKTQLVDLPKGSQVFPDAEKALTYMVADQHNRTLTMTASAGNPDHYQFQNVTRSIEGMKSAVVSAIKNKQEMHIHIEKPLKKWIGSADSYQVFLNNR